MLLASFIWLALGIALILNGHDATGCIIISQVWLAASCVVNNVKQN